MALKKNYKSRTSNNLSVTYRFNLYNTRIQQAGVKHKHTLFIVNTLANIASHLLHETPSLINPEVCIVAVLKCTKDSSKVSL